MVPRTFLPHSHGAAVRHTPGFFPSRSLLIEFGAHLHFVRLGQTTTGAEASNGRYVNTGSFLIVALSVFLLLSSGSITPTPALNTLPSPFLFSASPIGSSTDHANHLELFPKHSSPVSNTHSMGETEGNSTNGAVHANATSDSSTIASSSGGQDDQPPIAEPPDCTIEKFQPACAHPHTLSAQRVADELNTDLDNGLSTEEATARLARNGPNSIKGAKGVSVWEIFLQQVANALTAVLIAVTALSFAIHDFIEGGVVAAVIVLNIVVGYVLLLPTRVPRSRCPSALVVSSPFSFLATLIILYNILLYILCACAQSLPSRSLLGDA